MSFEVFLVKFGQLGWAGLLALGAYVWNKQETKTKDIDKKVDEMAKAHKDFITSSQAKQMMKEIVDPIIADQKEVKDNLKNILNAVHEIQTSLAVQAAVYKLQHTDKE